VAEKKESKSKADRGVVKFFFEIVKESGQRIQSGYKILMIKRK
jgi:hypothetical protein